ncbi:MAG: PAS domain-containing protein, partial [Planctomycetota bacterium]
MNIDWALPDASPKLIYVFILATVPRAAVMGVVMTMPVVGRWPILVREWRIVLDENRKILWIHSQPPAESDAAGTATEVSRSADVDNVSGVRDAISKLSRSRYDAVMFEGEPGTSDSQIVRLLQNEHILNRLSDGIALVDTDLVITWANECFLQWGINNPVGQLFYDALGKSEILGPDFCPFHTALATGSPSTTTLVTDENQYFELYVAPLSAAATSRASLVATLSEVTSEILQQQKLQAIHLAGRQLTDLKPDEIFAMDTQARIDLLKDNIRH